MELPRYDELPVRPGAPRGSSWGVWGDGDVLGCLNLLTPERALAGRAAVRDGHVFPLNLELDLPAPPLFGRSAFRHEVRWLGDRPEVGHDDELHGWNLQSSTQWDGFRHIRHPVHGFYGGVADEEHGVHHWARRGIVTRAVVCDVAGYRAAAGRPLALAESDQIAPEDVAGALAAQDVAVEPGDVLLIHTGWLSWYRTLGAAERTALARELAAPGLARGEGTVRFLWDLHVAAVAVDNPAVEAWPPAAGLGEVERAELRADPALVAERFVFLHLTLLPLLGLPLGELWDLGPLTAACRADGRWTCLLVSVPLNLPGGVATPANAVAVR